MQLLKSECPKVYVYTVLHEDKEYTLTDFFEEGKIVSSILRDKDGNNVEEPGLFEEICNFLDQEV